ncbi:MAG: hypothetical protein KGV44_00455 [Flavobacteriaceae bacterium]|nr:hypothetical protein [Flavobacteriaceae bacterium]
MQVVETLEDNLKKLLNNYQFLKEENDIMYQKVATLEEELITERRHFEELKKMYDSLKLAKTIEGSIESTKETKLKINTLVREIDACIEQLSK